MSLAAGLRAPSADHRGTTRAETAGGVVLVCGTRPELIKLSPLMSHFGDDCTIVYTGQHYDDSLYSRIRADLPPSARFRELGVTAAGRGAQLGKAISALDEVLAAYPHPVVLVQGDTTSALAGALAANARELPLVHIEAGLRSHDRAMPEEHNRILIDHVADLCCAPTDLNRLNLLAENIPSERVAVTGNTVVEALRTALPSAEDRATVLSARGLRRDEYALATIHRPENVDDPVRLAEILRELCGLPLPVVFPLHPRTGKSVERFGLTRLLEPLLVIEPQAYPAFLALAAEAAVVISDSGGIQEEVSVLKRPVVVVRRSTERPEISGLFGVLVPAGPLIGIETAVWLNDVAGHRERLSLLPSPYGDGSACRRIADAIEAKFPWVCGREPGLSRR
ncbi:non-hydrolyzing UDP-N-acetylglucosamine 2-epimerase [Amycolatopsis umgeniensis]|uniref:UDP-N-acetylglucosamine 2-epimerase (Non-hydrolyzing) n=1 Tax=Amycolatopsis umgeniensis TaxID=336628 RepID=A0A841AYF7_9PSEU|nr:UDP-N-acetylglucosamine 2-epimerase (non-hydrolyzing) [Amycolatopsis umgeniensis]MBB5851314.1 UDP-N-acetylglucosamine 2-epimerase (non-hydrolyzing) [Amycolatopsis umgeniensis]